MTEVSRYSWQAAPFNKRRLPAMKLIEKNRNPSNMAMILRVDFIISS